MSSDEQLRRPLARLAEWFQKRGPVGFDPYDYKAHPAYVTIAELADGSMPARIPLRVFELTADLFPGAIRRVLRVRPSILPKTQALLARGHLSLYRSGDKTSLDRAICSIEWLRTNSVLSGGEMGWGLPFDWKSRILIPKGTLASTVTVEAGDAFWCAFQATGDPQYFRDSQAVARGLYQRLRHQPAEEGLCFSYTPLDNFHVHNANIMTAEYLIRVGTACDNRDWVSRGIQAVRYSLSDQLEDGSFEYWGPSDRTFSHIDHYHTGFVIRALLRLTDHGVVDVSASLDRVVKHYLDHFFMPDGAPKMFPTRPYPFNIHSCAEAILVCHALATRGHVRAQEQLQATLDWVLERMQAPDGHFYYKRDTVLGIERTYRFPFTRWGQAWMWYALCKVAGGVS